MAQDTPDHDSPSKCKKNRGLPTGLELANKIPSLTRISLTKADAMTATPTDDEIMANKIINEGKSCHGARRRCRLSIDLEYKTWKKNSPYLYDMILRYCYPLHGLIRETDSIYQYRVRMAYSHHAMVPRPQRVSITRACHAGY